MSNETCKNCKKTIRNIRMRKGKPVPVDPEEVSIITRFGVTYKGFIPHLQTCTANEFSMKRATQGISMLQWQCGGCGDFLMQGHDCRKCGTSYQKGDEETCLPPELPKEDHQEDSESTSSSEPVRNADKPKFGSMAKKT